MKTAVACRNFPEAVLRILTVIVKSNVNEIIMEIGFEVGCW